MNPRSRATRFAAIAGCLLTLLLSCSAQEIRITEFMALNQTTLKDDFGEFSDWIEIYNAGDSGTNLQGYFLTDDPANLTKWRFPATNLPPRRFLIVFASGRDLAVPGAPLHTSFKLDGDGEFLALVAPNGSTVLSQFTFGPQAVDISFGLAFVATNEVNFIPTGQAARVFIPTADIGTNWIRQGFDDSAWMPAAAAIGFETNVTGISYASLIGTDLHAEMFVPRRPSAFLRIPIVLTGAVTVAEVQFGLRYDDGFAAYLNGTEIARRNAAISANWNSTANNQHANSLAVVPELFSVPGLPALLQSGTNVLAIHGLNRTGGDPDFLISPVFSGRDLVLRSDVQRFFDAPTPGAANQAGLAGLSGPVIFSRSSSTVTNPFTLTLTVARSVPGTVIRYTLDQTEPTETSPLYSAPLEIQRTVQVRARAFEPGFFPGPQHVESFVFLGSTAGTLTSDLPLLVLHTLGGGPITDAAQKPCYLEIHDAFRGRSSLLRAPELVTRAGAKVRGSSTGTQAKKALTIEFWDDEDQARDLSPLGMPAESDWVLYAVNNQEPVLIHNPYAQELYSQMGHYALRCRFVEVCLNETGGALTENNYFGLYVLMEKIKIGPDRVNIDQLGPADRAAPEVTGGYLFKIDRRDPGDSGFNGAGADLGSIGTCYVEPKESEIKLAERDAQEAYVAGFFNAFGAALNGTGFTDPITGYARYVDVDAAVDFHLLNTLTFTVDGEILSTFFYKPRGGKLTFGPPWDYDRSMGSLDSGFERDKSPRVWASQQFFFHMVWWERMFSDPNFWQRWIDRYQELRRGVFATDHLLEMVDQFADQVREAQVREVQRWPGFTTPRTGRLTTTSGYSFDFGAGGYQAEVEQMKHWLEQRVAFMDGNFLAPPVLSSPSARVAPGFAVSIAGPAGAIIYYTLDGTDPRSSGGGISSRARIYAQPLVLASNARLVARAYDSNHRNLTGSVGPPLSSPWSGPAAATYVLQPLPLLITELMYHPAAEAGESDDTADDYEFIELKNIGTAALNLRGFRFTNGVTFDFSTGAVASLNPGERVLVVKDEAAFTARYGTRGPIAGQYTGSLDNKGERISLVGPLQEPVMNFVYSDEWYPLTDGYGFSLVVTDETAPASDWNERTSWRQSRVSGGSPGEADGPPLALPAVVINEVLTQPGAGGSDLVELWNPGAEPADISHWWLSDDARTPAKYRFPTNTVIPANGYLLLSDTEFNAPGAATGFGLSGGGEEVWLFSADASGALTGWRHGFDFGAAEAGVSFGRYLTSTGAEHYPAQRLRSLGQTNAGPLVGPLVVTEVHYHPPDVRMGARILDDTADEFIELRNVTSQTVSLFDPAALTNTWRLTGAVEYVFPTNVMLAAQSRVLLVGFDPKDLGQIDAFRASYGLPLDLPVVGPWKGRLENSGGRVELRKPGPSGADQIPYILVDRVAYADEAPWPFGPDGIGASLQRLVEPAYGDDPTNWVAAAPTPGASYVPGASPQILSVPLPVTVIQFQNASFHVNAAGPAPLWYQWRFKNANVIGATNDTLLLTNLQPQQAGEYSVVVLNQAGSSLTQATLTVLPLPLISVQPEDLGLRLGTNASLLVTATGTGRLRYQWYLENLSLPGATNVSLLFPKIQFEQSGSYYVTVTDDIGSVTSRTAIVSVISPPFIIEQPGPPIITALEGDPLRLVVVAGPEQRALPLTYRWRRNGVFLPEGTNATLNVTLDNLVPLTALASTNTFSVLVTNSIVPNAFSSNVTVIVQADRDHDGAGDAWELQYGFDRTNPNDGLLDRDGDGVSNRDEFRAGTNPTDATSNFKVKLTASGPANDPFRLEFTAQGNRTYSVLWREAIDHGEWVTLTNLPYRSSNWLVQLSDPYPYPAAPQRMFRVVTPKTGESLRPGPVLLASPRPLQVAEGEPAQFQVLSVGAGPLGYSWLRNQSPIPLQTNAQLRIEAATTNDHGAYSVRITDHAGETVAQPVQLTVLVRPAIQHAPQDQSVSAGAPVSFRVEATGFEPLRYQWLHQWRVLRDQTNATLALPSATPEDAGLYSVIVRHTGPTGPAAARRDASLRVLP